MIRLQHVSMVFGAGPSRVAALSDVSFHIAKGEFVVLTGASGAGKTTLLRLLYRAESPSEGDIDVAGFDVAALRRSEIPRLRRSIGIVFQDAKLLAPVQAERHQRRGDQNGGKHQGAKQGNH